MSQGVGLRGDLRGQHHGRAELVFRHEHGLRGHIRSSDFPRTHSHPVHASGRFGNKVVDGIVADYLRTGRTEATDAPGYFEAR
ncbi:hypothetical protein [uncultured Corynebacterium sp.]|uniref:hypothetical protein n=1 Tax=uncultured Corynebacterium sp. TaxID=159447 RepID=UPI0025964B2C|nr:hypothetical protein [uncultured Corynebacterium sp.]